VLFNSSVFLFLFLPLALVLTYGARRFSVAAPKLTLTVLSLFFYAWWDPPQLTILLGAITFNYIVGGRVQRAYAAHRTAAVKTWLILGVLGDLALLGWFKYANFIAENMNRVFGAHISLPKIALPLAISFYTFQKLAYLIDSARGETKRISFLDFNLFASFFPQLIAGPIVHYREVVPQFQSRLFGTLVNRNLMVGLVIFAIGLFKKTVIADSLAHFANPLFEAAAKGENFNILTGWVAAVTFTLQV
jgi:alginate O-acetyltransferase complex protein AlgI